MTRDDLSAEGVVLRNIAYGESDRIVTLLTDSLGKVSAFARAAAKSQKRFGAALDLFSHVRVTLHPPRDRHGGLWRLREAHLLDPHLPLRGDLGLLAEASYLADCIAHLVGEGDPQPRLYSWWRETLTQLSQSKSLPASLAPFEFELLSLCGYAPHWELCMECGCEISEGKIFFSFSKGGTVCESCRSKHSGKGEGVWLDGRVVSSFRRGEELAPMEDRSLRRSMDSFLTFTLGRPLKSQAFRSEVLDGNG